MPKIISTMKQNLIEKFPVSLSEGWEICYASHPLNDDEIAALANDADYMMVGAVDTISRELIEKISHIKLIHSLGVGYDKIDLEAAKEHGIYVCNNYGVNSGPVAELAVTLMSAVLRRLAYTDAKIKAGGYDEQFVDYRIRGQHELGAMKVGLVGMGSIGKHVAKILSAFGCELYYSDVRRLDGDTENKYGLKYLSLEELCAISDIISFHVPVLESTRGMVNKDLISTMKDDVIIINVSRGEIVNNNDLKEALESAKIYAGLDVIAPEPPSKDHPLLNLNETGRARLIITPHIGGTTDEAFIRMIDWTYKNMLKVECGEEPIHIVNGYKIG